MVDKMERGGTYRHTSSGDLDIEVTQVLASTEEMYTLLVKWIKKTDGRQFKVKGDTGNGLARVQLLKKDLHNWIRLK